VLTIFADSPALRLALTALRGEAKGGLRVRAHPWVGPPRMVTVFARTPSGARAVAELERQFPTCAWTPKGWKVARVQLPLFRETQV
jgi:hypothetical protein